MLKTVITYGYIHLNSKHFKAGYTSGANNYTTIIIDTVGNAYHKLTSGHIGQKS